LEWLLFSPSSLEGRSSSLGHFAGASLSPSFTDVVKRKGKAPLDGSPADPGHTSHNGKEPMGSSPPSLLPIGSYRVASWQMPAIML
jgi:hypothetical protein